MSSESNTFMVTSVNLKQSQGKHRKHRPSNEELSKRLDELERACNELFEFVVEAIERVTKPGVRKRKPIGFRAKIPKK